MLFPIENILNLCRNIKQAKIKIIFYPVRPSFYRT